MDAPIVVAKGIDFLALKMRDTAKELDIPIVENRPMARELYALVEEGESIPDNMFKGSCRDYPLRVPNEKQILVSQLKVIEKLTQGAPPVAEAIASKSKNPTLAALRSPDVQFALGLVGIIFMMIIPLTAGHARYLFIGIDNSWLSYSIDLYLRKRTAGF